MTRMTNAGWRVIVSRLLRPPRSAVFFVLFYLYFVFEIDLRLLYHCGGLIDDFPTFYKGWDFLRGFLGHPGGLLEYVSAFLAQLFYYSWAGAAVVTGQAWLMCVGTDCLLKTVGASRWRGLRFVGPLLLLVAYSQYWFSLPTTTGFLVALLALCLYLRQRPDKVMPRLALFLVVSIVLYVIAGGPFLLFSLLAGLYEFFFCRRVSMALAHWAAGAVVPFVLGVMAYSGRPHDAYFELLPLSWKVVDWHTSGIVRATVYSLYLFLPFVITVLGIRHFRLGKAPMGSATPEASASPPASKRARWVFRSDERRAFGLNFPTLVLAVVTVAVLAQFRDTKLRTLFQVDYYSRQKMWSKVIEVGRHSSYHYLICHAVNRALYHTGRLGDEMFSFPQNPEALMLTASEALWQKSDTCIDLGLPNEAENALMICMETFGERPLVLQRLAWVHLAKGNISAARVLLEALSKVPFWTARAQDWLARLDSDPGLRNDPEIERLRAVMLRTDSVRGGDSLVWLLRENARNRMAYEYRLAALLLAKDLETFVQTFEASRSLYGSEIPRHHREALLLYRTLKQQPIDVPGQSIPRAMMTQLHEFFQVLRQHGRDMAAARAALKPSYGDTYFYYFFLGGEGRP
ncbi:MAG: hypothetical protein JW993_05690 [Sedimentisphaerales bacterium]|nr:hypothetical protein [Sedimentisphaerales bacterium]